MTAAGIRAAATSAVARPAGIARRRTAALTVSLPLLVAIAAGIGGFAWMAWLGWRRAEGLTTNAYDQAYFQQLVWSIGHGRGFHSSFNPGDFLGLHFSPLLVVPAFLELAWPDARVLTLLQAAALGADRPGRVPVRSGRSSAGVVLPPGWRSRSPHRSRSGRSCSSRFAPGFTRRRSPCRSCCSPAGPGSPAGRRSCSPPPWWRSWPRRTRCSPWP